MLNKIRKLRAKKGFTLVELIVVIAIIAILTAVLVPLVGNYVQQAAYTTLMDAAQTISNTGNNALANYSATGKVCNVSAITGTKSEDKDLIVKIFIDDEGGKKKEDTNKTTISEEMVNTLKNTVPSTCAFYIAVDNGAVEGVVYVNDKNEIAQGKTKDAGIDGKDFFQNSKDGKVDGSAIGVSGIYKAEGENIVQINADGTIGENKD